MILILSVAPKKLDRAEEVLVVRILDMIPANGSFNTKYNAVMAYFGAQGTCVLEGVKELYAMSTEKCIVYIRFLTKKAKYNAEAKFKSFKSLNPNVRFNVARPNVDKFSSDVRQSRDEI